ncbi:MAG: copper-binding protein [Alphaproteobacteria bacterium]
MKTKFLAVALITLLQCFAGYGLAHAHPGHEVGKGEGVIKAINEYKVTITLEYRPIADLDWPADTKTFEAASSALLKEVKINENVDFTLKNFNQKYILTEIRPK